jgi:hypothetical protein
MQPDHADYPVWVAAMTGTDGTFEGKAASDAISTTFFA